jgi:4-hydroxybenzoate polyprenyltransferase
VIVAVDSMLAGTLRAPARARLYVDLDGTLVRTDTLWETCLLYVAHHPLGALRIPAWLARGRAALKAELARHVALPADALPYRPEVLAFMREASADGTEVVLATAADARIAHAVASHVGGFSDVLASDGTANLKGRAKLEAIRAHAGGAPFTYIGNDAADFPILDAAAETVIAADTPEQVRAMRSRYPRLTVLGAPRPRLDALAKLARPQQWIKNLLVFVPLLLAHQALRLDKLVPAFAAFVAFSLCASAVYVVNDLADVQADRRHPRKRHRPVAAGTVAIPHAVAMAVLLAGASLALSLAALPWTFVGVLALYFATSQAYSLVLKRIAVLDVLVLASLYALRLLAGAVATRGTISGWLLAFALFLFLSLAYVKRYTELLMARERGETSVSRRGYGAHDLELIRSVGPASGYLAVLVLALYTSSEDVRVLYSSPHLLWLLGPLLLFWISRTWLLAHRGQMHDDPIVYAVKDRPSYLVGALAVAVTIAASLA